MCVSSLIARFFACFIVDNGGVAFCVLFVACCLSRACLFACLLLFAFVCQVKCASACAKITQKTTSKPRSRNNRRNEQQTGFKQTINN